MADPDVFVAEIRAWSEKAKRNLDLVARASAQEVFERASQRQPSVKETGGTFEIGKVPVDTGFLIGTSEVRINGAPHSGGSGAREASSLPPDFAAVIGSMKMGDTIEYVFTAPYARAVEYGTGKMAGRLFVRTAIKDWDIIVQAEAARFRD